MDDPESPSGHARLTCGHGFAAPAPFGGMDLAPRLDACQSVRVRGLVVAFAVDPHDARLDERYGNEWGDTPDRRVDSGHSRSRPGCARPSGPRGTGEMNPEGKD
jgi:hypothetical protein